MKILFLDVDGVLNQADDFYIYTTPAAHMFFPKIVDMNKVSMLNFLLTELNKFEPVKIVVSSAWRKDAYNLEEFVELTGIGIEFFHEDWRTDTLGHSDGGTGPRPQEVQEWLDKHPQATEWLALDDLPFAFPEANFIKTDGLLGVTFENFEELLRRWGYQLDYQPKEAFTGWAKYKAAWVVNKTPVLVA